MKEAKFTSLINTLTSLKKDFKIETTGSFYSIIYNEEKFNFFPKEKISFKALSVAKKIKNDIDKSGLKVDKNNLSEYFLVNESISDKILKDKIYGVDIKQAYLYCLYNRGLITKETKELSANLSKKERLSTIGMLARKKVISEYKDGKMTACNNETSKHEMYFYFCVETIYLLMKEISLFLEDSFLFFWVDCIFFIGEKNIKKVQDFLSSNKYYSTVENLELKGISENKNFVNIDLFNFQKNCVKPYRIPKNDSEVLLNKARYSIHNLDHKNFAYYFNEYKKLNIRKND